MSRSPSSVPSQLAPPGVPPGAPAWVDGQLIALTIRVWQPYYEAELTPADALAMLLGTAQLWDTITKRGPS